MYIIGVDSNKKVISVDNKFARKTIKEKLILAGIDEIGNCGVAGFSLRQVAVACNVSCATPYNYFKNKEGFVVEIIQYIKYQWGLLKTEINKVYKNDEKQQLIELCVFYIKFLVGNPNYRSIIMLDNLGVDDESYNDIENARNFIELELEHYMKINNVSAREARRKSFVIRAIVFEATLLLERGDLENTPENFDFIRYCVARELALV